VPACQRLKRLESENPNLKRRWRSKHWPSRACRSSSPKKGGRERAPSHGAGAAMPGPCCTQGLSRGGAGPLPRSVAPPTAFR
jgi:hypothetical protein